MLLSTGVGVGPMLGYAEAALAEKAGPAIELYAGFRDRADVCCGEELDALRTVAAQLRKEKAAKDREAEERKGELRRLEEQLRASVAAKQGLHDDLVAVRQRSAAEVGALLKGAAKAIPNSDFKAHNRIVPLHD